MKKIITILCTIAFLAGGMSTPAGAALNAVGPIDAADGFPIWYEDTVGGLRLEKCLVPGAQCLNPELTLPTPGAAVSFPANYFSEWFYFNATADIAGDIVARCVLALEGTLPIPAAGQQTVFARILLTLRPTTAATANVPVTITHPFGSITVTTRNVGQTLRTVQDVGVAAGIFNGALLDAPVGGIVNATGASLGPFLTAAPPAPARVIIGGNTYIGDGVTPVAVTGSPVGTNLFQIVGGGVNATQTLFTLMGKVSGCVAGITPPVAVADPGAAAASGAPQIINVTANDLPGTTPAVVGPPAVPAAPIGINKGSIIVTLPIGGTAVPNPDGTVTYTPNPDFIGTGGFTYTVQDNCGQATLPMAVPAVVENLTVDRAEFRARTGKWTITGQSSAPANSTMTVHKGDAAGPVIGTTTVQNGTYEFVGKSKTAPGPPTTQQPVTAQSAATVTRTKVLRMQ